jgi:polyisoprenoid-binding protein YceI
MATLQTEAGAVRVPAGVWNVDPVHTSVGFEVKHMMIATVRGRFHDFEGTIESGETLEECRAYGTVRTASIDTGNADRDAHLRSPEFFDVERYPEIRFESTEVQHLGGNVHKVFGDLTIKGDTRPVELEATVEGAGVDPWGNERVGVALRGSINRNDFGLTWQQRLVTGGLLVGDEVTLVIDASCVRAAAPA